MQPELSEPESTHQVSQNYNSETCLKGILKKNSPEVQEWSGTDSQEPSLNHHENGEDCTDPGLLGRIEGTERKSSIRVAPWRQRARNRRETPTQALSEQDAAQEEWPSRTPPPEEIISSKGNGTGQVNDSSLMSQEI